MPAVSRLEYAPRAHTPKGGKRQGRRFPPAQGIEAEFPGPGGAGELERIARFFAKQKMRPTYPRCAACSQLSIAVENPPGPGVFFNPALK
jgi:hypothetical protein